MAGEPLRIVRAGRLAAVAGALSRPPRASLAALRRYDAALQALAGELPAMLPARFGTCMVDEDELAAVLRARDIALHDALREVRGCVQMTLRGMDVRDAPVPSPAVVDRGSGVAYLKSLVAEASRAPDVPALAPVLAAVAGWVRAVRVARSGAVATVYHLVPQRAAQSYATAARAAADAAGLRVVVAGPFPAHAFGEAW
jgi:hypothetical protein